LLGEREKFGVNRFTVTPGLLLTRVWLPLCCPSAFFQAARFWALCFRVNFLLHRRGQKATSLANRGGIPIAGQLGNILTYWRKGAPISYTASLFANICGLLVSRGSRINQRKVRPHNIEREKSGDLLRIRLAPCLSPAETRLPWPKAQFLRVYQIPPTMRGS
jgi:hypothetical protein